MNRTTIPRGRRGPAGAALLATAALLLTACGGGQTSSDGSTGAQAGDDTTLVVGVAGDPATLDPGTASEPIANTIIKNTYFQLTKYGVLPEEDGAGYQISDVSTTLGEFATAEWSSDGLVGTFTIVDGAVFPSGNPITADDYLYTVDRALTTALTPIFLFQTAGITDVSQVAKISDTQFTITLPEPSPMFGALMRDQDTSVLDSKLLQEHATTDDPWALDWLALNSTGGGAYTLDSYEPGSQVVLTKNEDYPDADDIYFDTVIMQIIPSETDRAQLLANGTLDIAEGLSLDAVADLKDADGVRVLDIPSRSQSVLSLVQNFEPFADPQVREAVARAVPYDDIVSSIAKGYAAAPASLWPQRSAWFDADLDNSPTTTDVDEAKKLLAAAGYADGFEFAIDVSTADALGQSLAVAMQSALADIGLTVTINQLAPGAFAEQINSREGQAFIQSNSLAYVDDPYYMIFLYYTSDAILNRTGMNVPEMDALAAEMKPVTDSTQRQALASQAQEMLNDEVPVVPLMEADYLIGIGDDIDGFVLEPDNLTRYATLSRTE